MRMSGSFLALLIATAVVALTPADVTAQPAGVADPEKAADIRRLLELSGGAQVAAQVIRPMVEMFRKQAPQVPAAFWDEVEEEFVSDARAREMIDLVVPIYDRSLTHDDIKQIIAFYESPAGRRFVSVMPQIAQESLKVGQDWGLRIGQEIAERLRARGY